ncbi:xanthine dehydrogenase YagR molybdenum-binding subunit [Mycolicibacterium rutilum]|uniref:Xanthine dehydrogenase YagR molybdenum-binding subunit n=1 Tax=Mycolicibacterium rutilum TaxID=370526 RepID=A0A1H6J3P2_MYCRU|nr:xanthine dehydrogenase family protein molybdopterin-binding subunit [Mycolicibacterium rutilum]SEH54082.1 xanthine dehydrogenase YagR molybdenum-binding subunit [Mycolicibacterium rutilum]
MTSTIGRAIPRVEARDKVTGRAVYTADVAIPGLTHAVLVQSDIASGRVREESLLAAAAVAGAAPGVLHVITPLNCPTLKPPPSDMSDDMPLERRPPLSDLTVQYVGQHMAVVVADTLENASYAASLMRLDYDEHPAVLTADEVRAGGGRVDEGDGPIRHGLYWPDHFVKLEHEKLQDRRGPQDAPPGVEVSARFTTGINTHYPLELSATIAEWDGAQLTVHDTTRWIAGERRALASYLDMPEDDIRILAPLVGGAFGSKNFLWMHVALCAVAAREVQRPVKLVLTRHQMLTSTGHRPRTDQHVALVADNDGAIASTEHHTLTETSTVAHFCEPVGLSARFLYRSARMVVSHQVARINMATPCFMRGPGEAPGLFALEVAMDELAYQTGIDPVELRIRNDVDVDQPSGRPFAGRHLRQCYEIGAERFGWSERPMTPRSMRRRGVRVGWGTATASYAGRRMPASCRVTTFVDGTVEFASATHEIGTGVRTVMSQIAADAAGLPLSRVTFASGDSWFATAPYSGASQTTASVGSAVHAAAREWRSRVDGGASDPADLSFTVSTGGVDDAGPLSQSFGAHFCEVEVDEQIGRIAITRWVAVMDCGRVLNPTLARSQVVGGIVFGLGMALMESAPYDPRTARPIGEYYVPTHADVPAFDIDFIDTPDSALTEIGVRGIGEIGACGVPAAVGNALFHATGRRLRDLPITLEHLMIPFDEENADD